jgi:hypothetical protein
MGLLMCVLIGWEASRACEHGLPACVSLSLRLAARISSNLKLDARAYSKKPESSR